MGRLVSHWVCVFALVALPVAGCSDDGPGVGLQREQAVQTVVNEVLIPAGLGASDVVVYAPVEPLQAGDRVLPVLEADGSQAAPFVIGHATWFFWIDLVPFARFAHPALRSF